MSNNNIQIMYNGVDVFEGIAPAPFVSFSQDFIDFGNKWNQVTNIVLEGQITGKYVGPSSFQYLNENSLTLLNRLSQNYKSFSIKENNEVIYNANTAVINSINFEENIWYGILPFNIELSVYDQELYTNHYGVIEPSEEISFSEEEGEIISLTHNLSAKGFQTNSLPLTNAKNWVSSRQNNFNKVSPILVKNNNNSFIKFSEKETIDRFNSIYSKEITYRKSLNKENPSNCFLDYSINLASGEQDGFLIASINGNFNGAEISTLKNQYLNLNLFNICNDASKSAFNSDLSSRPIEQNIQENESKNNLEFSATFNNDFTSEIIHDYKIDISVDTLKCIATIIVNGNISCKYGDIAERFSKSKDFYKKIDIYSLAKEEYQKEITNANVLNQTPKSVSETYNEFEGTVSYNFQYDNKKQSFVEDIISINSNVSLTPSIKVHIPHGSAITPREYNIQNLNAANRTILKISVSAIAKQNSNISVAEKAVNDEVNRILGVYQTTSSPLEEEKTVSKDIDMKTFSINQTITYEGEILS